MDTLLEMLVERSWAGGDPSARSMLLVGGNLLKAAVMVMGAITTAATFGYPVTTVVAGLGIGGIAFAFGAQKTVENLFGSIALAADQPCRVGDTVKVEDVVGQVEYIGTRSTRIRTADRTLVTIPNGRLADSRIESYAVRDRIRLATTITLGYGAERSAGAAGAHRHRRACCARIRSCGRRSSWRAWRTWARPPSTSRSSAGSKPPTTRPSAPRARTCCSA